MENQVLQPKERKRFGYFHLIGGLILLFIIFVIIAEIEGEKKEPGFAQVSQGQKEASEKIAKEKEKNEEALGGKVEEEQNQVQIYDIGENINLEQQIIVVHSAREYIEPDEFHYINAGTRHIAVDVSIENTGTESIAIFPDAFTIHDAQGYSYMFIGGVTAKEPILYFQNLPAKRKIRGFLVFEVPRSVSDLELVYAYPYSDKQAVVKLNE